MWLLYDLIIHLYEDALRIAARFNPKARLWVQGRQYQLDSWTVGQLDKESRQSAPTLGPSPDRGRERPGDRQAGEGDSGGEGRAVAWFHCASLGEFEQGRPVIERFRQEHPEWKILLTFFSPSGYEVRKNYTGADGVMYLPMDRPRNVNRFLDTFQPSIAVFVKYEFWFRYIDQLHKRNIPIYLISGIFRPQQHFFRWYGGWFRQQLNKFTHFWVQDIASQELLMGIGLGNVTVSGDTRFDRVAAIAGNAKPFPLIEQFAEGKQVFLAGSTWPADEELILDLMKEAGDDIRFIIAPHEVSEQRIQALCKQAGSPEHGEGSACVRFSQLTPETASASRVLIVDGIGYLSHLYQYATIAYIGGGFGAGIHNILEAATFGKPVVFGPNFGKFREAMELVKEGGAFPVQNEQELKQVYLKLMKDEDAYRFASEKCKKYVDRNRGATAMILEGIRSDR